MLQSKLATKTMRESPKSEQAINAQLLERAGFVSKIMSGVYAYLPLGNRVLGHIERIVREEMNRIGGQELLLPALHPKELWMQTGRWDNFDALFRIQSRHDMEFALGATHEEVIVPVIKAFLQSYKDVPVAVYQIQTKFRDEPRAKSGVLRGREFRMKDMYSFHVDEHDLDAYYITAGEAYRRIFGRIGLTAHYTEASGGTFSKYSHEFQVPIETGEDTIYYCKKCDYAVNSEISKKGECPKCNSIGEKINASEVGNIFKLNTKYSAPFDLCVTDESGNRELVRMGCYGIGTSRVLGTVVESSHDERGIIWPVSIAPFLVHIVPLTPTDADTRALIMDRAHKLLRELEELKIDVLLDDRVGQTAGEKFADADLIGIPLRVVISEKTIASGGYELKKRNQTEMVVLPPERIIDGAKEQLIRSQL